MAKENRYSEGKVCRHCGKPIPNKNRLGSCAHCRMTIDQCGAGNHMYGKVYTKEELEKCAVRTRNLWRNPEYRKKVVSNATGLHRSEEFKKEQSVRTKASYNKINGLRAQRGKLFSQCWKDGRTKVHFYKYQKSPIEQSLSEVIKSWGYSVETSKTIIYGDKKWYRIMPDIIVDGKIVVEFYGDYFHGNPKIYKPTDIIGFQQLAQEKWQKDKLREKRIRGIGYEFYVVWENDLKNSKEETLLALKNYLKEKLRRGEK